MRSLRRLAITAGVVVALAAAGAPAYAVVAPSVARPGLLHVAAGSATPVPTYVAAGPEQNCDVLSNHTVDCWGWNFYGDLGNGTKTNALRPTPVPGLVNVKQVTLSYGHTCALLYTGRVECWGWNANGQLGDGTEVLSTRPVMVKGLASVKQISIGFETSCALLFSGGVRCWGWNGNGQLGDGTTGTTQSPVSVVGLSGVSQVSVGYAHSCAVVARGAVRCWGLNNAGQLGDGSTSQSTTPVPVRGLLGVRDVSLGYQHTCAVLDSGGVKCWGLNQFGQLGDGSHTSTRTPVEVLGVRDAMDVSSAYGDSCALLRTHRIECWGWNGNGQLGTGNHVSSSVPMMTRNLTGVLQVSAGDYHTCALLTHAVSCWGRNASGELGVGTTKSIDAPLYLPSAPGSVRARGLNVAALVTWHPSRVDGGTSSLSYTVTSAPGGHTCVGHLYSCTVTGLTNGAAYRFFVTASNVVGSSRPSPSPSVIPATVPDPPTSVSGQRENEAALVSWLAPASDGGHPIVSYTVTASPGGHTCVTTHLSCPVGGLVNGVSYTFTVTAKNLVGTSSASTASGPVVPAAVPDPPTSVSATPGNTTAAVTWTAANANGSAILTYDVTATDHTNALRGGETCSTAGTIGCTVIGLTNGDAYTFTVVATNHVGASPASAPSAVVTPATLPGAPTAVVATPGDASAAVTWTAPVSNGGSPITSYKVTATDTTNALHGGETCSTAGTIGCTVPLLTNGDAYTFTVTATSVAGTSAPSAPSAPVTPAAVPGQPTGVVAVPGDTTASVTWTAPTSNGGSPITSYDVLATDTTAPHGGQSCSGTTPQTGCTVTGLTNGDAYTFTVTAINGAGASTPSSPSSPVTPAAVPTSPSGAAATPGNANASVTWSPPSSDGGSAIVEYDVTATDHTNGLHGGETCSTSGTLGCTVTGLTNGDSYTFTVTATNGAGTGPASAPSAAVVPFTVPGAPTAVAATPSDASAAVTWTAPFNGGRAITHYDVTAADQTHVLNGGQTCSTTGTIGCTVSGLVNGDAYTFTVTATNAAGTGAASSPSTAVTPSTVPGAPTSAAATPGNTSAAVTWSAPTSDGGSAIVEYDVTAADQTNALNGGQTCSTTGTIGCTVSGLTNGDAYTFTVTATNGTGTGAASAPSAAVTPFTTPDAPSGVVATPHDMAADVTWTAPGFDGGSAITGYLVTASDALNPGLGGQTCTTSGTIGCTVSGLTDLESYTFTVTASNAAGSGSPSAPSLPVVPMMGLIVVHVQVPEVASIDGFNAVYLGAATSATTRRLG